MGKKIAYITDIHLDEKFPIDQGVDTRKIGKRYLMTFLRKILMKSYLEVILVKKQ
jgi:hypothetical protein